VNSPAPEDPTGLVGRVAWLLTRANAMSASELAWRTRSEVANLLPRRRLPEGRHVDWAHPGWNRELRTLVEPARAQLLKDAEAIARGELLLWGRPVRFDAREVDWRVDPLSGAKWPGGSWRSSGLDPKPTWELHRQQHLVPLAAGAYLAARRDWADICIEQLERWAELERPGAGPGWASAYEVACRLVTWAWAVPLISEFADPSVLGRLESSFLEQARFVERRPSRYSSENNHRLVELVGLLSVALLTGDQDALERVRAELERQADRQTFADGGSREQAGGYFLYVLETLWVAGITLRAANRPLGSLEERLDAMLGWLRATSTPDGEPPAVGDDAEDRLVRLDYSDPRRASAISGRVARLLGSPETPKLATTSVVLPESGYAVLRSEPEKGAATIAFIVGELGFGTLAAHGHADALSVLLGLGDTTILRDSGTGSYAHSGGRELFKSTAFHNTVVVDGESQARSRGAHLWGRRYTPTVEAVSLASDLDYVRASHDGYLRRHAAAIHTRSLIFLKPDLLVVLDRVEARRDCTATLVWQGMPGDEPERLAGGTAALSVEASPASAFSIEPGRFSPRYTWQETAPRFVWTAIGRDVVFVTAVAFGSPEVQLPVVELEHEANSVLVEVVGCRTTRIVEDWRSNRPEVRV
jgi:hypothetical protein